MADWWLSGLGDEDTLTRLDGDCRRDEDGNYCHWRCELCKEQKERICLSISFCETDRKRPNAGEARWIEK